MLHFVHISFHQNCFIQKIWRRTGEALSIFYFQFTHEYIILKNNFCNLSFKIFLRLIFNNKEKQQNNNKNHAKPFLPKMVLAAKGETDQTTFLLYLLVIQARSFSYKCDVATTGIFYIIYDMSDRPKNNDSNVCIIDIL